MKRPESLCWQCDNTGGRCPWTKAFQPVEGWKAEPVTIKNYAGTQSIESYCVIKCPLFKKLTITDTDKSYFSMLYKKFRSWLTLEEQAILDKYFGTKKVDLYFSERTYYRRIKSLKIKLLYFENKMQRIDKWK